VNLLLTLVTLGIYSAWAKVRRMKYLHENTELMGAEFGYHGDAFKILIGRVVVLAVVGGFYVASHFYPVISPIGSFIWVLLLPALLTLALYFRLRNTSYRSLRFAFKGTIGQSYRVMALPLTMALVGLGAVAIAIVMLGDGKGAGAGLFVGLLMLVVYVLFPILVMPLFHVQWKRFSHQHSHFGSVQFGFTATLGQYVKAYGQSFGIFFGSLIALVVMVIAVVAWQFRGGQSLANPAELFDKAAVIGVVIVVVYALMFTIQPYMKALFFNLAWNNTQIAGQSFRSTLTKWGMVKLGVTNLVLTVLTLGFFRPFAVIRTQRYLLEHLHLDLAAKGIVMVNSLDQANPTAHAEGALDLLGDLDM
jgi:uncharacterized membrane protein YjgN (DUF898 family)